MIIPATPQKEDPFPAKRAPDSDYQRVTPWIIPTPGRLHGLPHRRAGRFGHAARLQRRVGEGDDASGCSAMGGGKLRNKLGKGPSLLMEIDGDFFEMEIGKLRCDFLGGNQWIFKNTSYLEWEIPMFVVEK